MPFWRSHGGKLLGGQGIGLPERKQRVSNGCFRDSGTGTGPNIGLEPTRNSLRSSLAPALARGSAPAFGCMISLKGKGAVVSLEDKLAIQEVIAQYAYTWDAQDVEGLAALFTADAGWEMWAPGAPHPEVCLAS